jgi:hypothetical protein
MTEDRDERDQPAARLAEVAKRGLKEIGGDARLRLKAVDECGGPGTARAQLAECQPDQHGTAGAIDQGVREGCGEEGASQLPGQSARLVPGETAEPERGEAGQRQVFPADREEPSRRRAR